MAFRSASTATYTFASGSTGSTVDLGANNNYRYINATNVYNKGKADNQGIPTTFKECVLGAFYSGGYSAASYKSDGTNAITWSSGNNWESEYITLSYHRNYEGTYEADLAHFKIKKACTMYHIGTRSGNFIETLTYSAATTTWKAVSDPPGTTNGYSNKYTQVFIII